MTYSVVYEVGTGRITEYSAPPMSQVDVEQLDQNLAALNVETFGGEQLFTHYITGGALTERPAMPLTGGDPVAVGELWRIDGIPAGTEVEYPGGSLVVDDGFIELSFAEPGEYRFRFSKFPYLEEERIATISGV